MPVDLSKNEIAKLMSGICVSVVLPGSVAGIVTGTQGGSAGDIITAILAAGGCGLVTVAAGSLCVLWCYKKCTPNDPNNVLERDSDPENRPEPPPPPVVVPLTLTLDPRTPTNSLSVPYPGPHIDPVECSDPMPEFSPRLSYSKRVLPC